MKLLESLGLFLRGIFKRIYWILPTLLLDPFDLLERLWGISYEVPQWAIWTLFAIGWLIASLLTYHELRMQKVALKKPLNWVEAYKREKGMLPPMPGYLLPVVANYVPGEPISENIQLVTPSTQFWNNLLPSQQDQLLKLVEWLGQNPEDYLARMKMMSPPGKPGMRLLRK